MSDPTNQLLFGDDEKAKARASTGQRATAPGVVGVSGDSKPTPNDILFGDDEKAKARASSGKRATAPGVVRTNDDSKPSPNEVLFGGDDEKAKVRASAGNRATTPGVVTMNEDKYASSNVNDVLFGNADDEAAKARASTRKKASAPGVTEVTERKSKSGKSKRKTRAPKSKGTKRLETLNDLEQFMDGAAPVGTTQQRTIRSSTDSRMDQQMNQIGLDRQDNEDDENARNIEENRKRKRKRRNILLLLLLLLLGVGAVVALFLLGVFDKKSESSPLNDSPTSAQGNTPTSSPTISSFDPPSDEDCAAIATSGEKVEGQDDMITKNVDVAIEVTLGPESNMESLLPELLEKIKMYLVPSLAGCAESQERRVLSTNEKEPFIRGSRKLLGLDRLRNIIANANVFGKIEIDQSCLDNTENCHVVVVTLELILKDNAETSELRSFIENLITSSDVTIIVRLRLSDGFILIELVKKPTIAPAVRPSAKPNAAPIEKPATAPAAAPFTPLPTPIPTQRPTRVPSPGQTPDPTEEPTKNPTKVPTLEPTNAPTCGDIETYFEDTPLTEDGDKDETYGYECINGKNIIVLTRDLETCEVECIQRVVFDEEEDLCVDEEIVFLLGGDFKDITLWIGHESEDDGNALDCETEIKITASPTLVPTGKTDPPISETPIPTPDPTPGPTDQPTPDPTPEPTVPTTPDPTPAPTCLNCDGENACPENLDVGCGSCMGTHACFDATGVIRDNSCLSPNNSNIQFGACRTTQANVGAESCIGPGSCTMTQGVVGDNSCTGQAACRQRELALGANGGTGSCKGFRACGIIPESGFGLLTVDSESCKGNYTCFSREGSVGENSCLGKYACAGRNTISVGNDSCIGDNACPNGLYDTDIQPTINFFLTVGEGSCRCAGCCACIKNKSVGNGKCNNIGVCCDADGSAVQGAVLT